MTIVLDAHQERLEQKKIDFMAQLAQTLPESRFNVGSIVIFTNEFGVEFKRAIIGFAKPETLGYERHHCIQLDKSCYWVPVPTFSLRFEGEPAPEMYLTRDLTLKNGQKAKFLRFDDWCRPTYVLENGCIVCCVNLNGTYLHTVTLVEGEPLAALGVEFQPK